MHFKSICGEVHTSSHTYINIEQCRRQKQTLQHYHLFSKSRKSLCRKSISQNIPGKIHMNKQMEENKIRYKRMQSETIAAPDIRWTWLNKGLNKTYNKSVRTPQILWLQHISYGQNMFICDYNRPNGLSVVVYRRWRQIALHVRNPVDTIESVMVIRRAKKTRRKSLQLPLHKNH